MQQQQRLANQSRPPTPPKVPAPSLSGDCGDPDYEIIEFPPQNQDAQKNAQQKSKASSSGLSNGSGVRKCALCGTEAVSVRCNTCAESYCDTCDEVNHKHPKRRGHIRREIAAPESANLYNNMVKPPLPPKGENANPPPVPPPRRNRRNSNQVGCSLI